MALYNILLHYITTACVHWNESFYTVLASWRGDQLQELPFLAIGNRGRRNGCPICREPRGTQGHLGYVWSWSEHSCAMLGALLWLELLPVGGGGSIVRLSIWLLRLLQRIVLPLSLWSSWFIGFICCKSSLSIKWRSSLTIGQTLDSWFNEYVSPSWFSGIK